MCEIVTQYDTQALLSQALGLHIFFWFMLAYSIDHNLVMVFPSKIYMTTISSETKITTSYKNHIHLTTISLIITCNHFFFGIFGDAGQGVIMEFTVLSGPCFCGRWLGSGPPRRGAFRGEKCGFSRGIHGDFMGFNHEKYRKNGDSMKLNGISSVKLGIQWGVHIRGDFMGLNQPNHGKLLLFSNDLKVGLPWSRWWL